MPYFISSAVGGSLCSHQIAWELGLLEVLGIPSEKKIIARKISILGPHHACLAEDAIRGFGQHLPRTFSFVCRHSCQYRFPSLWSARSCRLGPRCPSYRRIQVRPPPRVQLAARPPAAHRVAHRDLLPRSIVASVLSIRPRPGVADSQCQVPGSSWSLLGYSAVVAASLEVTSRICRGRSRKPSSTGVLLGRRLLSETEVSQMFLL